MAGIAGRDFTGAGWTQFGTPPGDYVERNDGGGSVTSVESAGTAGYDGIVSGFYGAFNVSMADAGNLASGTAGGFTSSATFSLGSYVTVTYEDTYVEDFTGSEGEWYRHRSSATYSYSAFGVSGSQTLTFGDPTPGLYIGTVGERTWTMSFDHETGLAEINAEGGPLFHIDLAGVDGSGFTPYQDLGSYQVSAGVSGGGGEPVVIINQAAFNIFGASPPEDAGAIRGLYLQLCGSGPCCP